MTTFQYVLFFIFWHGKYNNRNRYGRHFTSITIATTRVRITYVGSKS